MRFVDQELPLQNRVRRRGHDANLECLAPFVTVIEGVADLFAHRPFDARFVADGRNGVARINQEGPTDTKRLRLMPDEQFRFNAQQPRLLGAIQIQAACFVTVVDAHWKEGNAFEIGGREAKVFQPLR